MKHLFFSIISLLCFYTPLLNALSYGDGIYLKSIQNTYLQANPDKATTSFDSTLAGRWSVFEIVNTHNPSSQERVKVNDVIALRSYHDTYLSHNQKIGQKKAPQQGAFDKSITWKVASLKPTGSSPTAITSIQLQDEKGNFLSCSPEEPSPLLSPSSDTSILLSEVSFWNAQPRLQPLQPFQEPLRYGSIITLRHAQTNNLLHSYPKKYTHPGTSGKQKVLCNSERTAYDLWYVKGPHGKGFKYQWGQPIKNGDIIRLQHIATNKNLSMSSKERFPGKTSPTFQWSEVYCAAQAAPDTSLDFIGDKGDDWIVQTEGNAELWNTAHTISLKHVLTRSYLVSSPRCAASLANKQEIGATKNQGALTQWVVESVVQMPAPPEANQIPSDFIQIPGGLVTITAGNESTLYGVNEIGDCYKLGTAPNSPHSKIDLVNALTISVGSDGEVWATLRNGSIKRFDGSSWTTIPGTLKQIAVANKTTIWGIDFNDGIWRYNEQKQWQTIDGTATHVSVANNEVYVSNRSYNTFSRVDISESNKNGTAWKKIDLLSRQTAIANSNAVIALTPDFKLVKKSEETWLSYEGSFSFITVAQDGTIGALTPQPSAGGQTIMLKKSPTTTAINDMEKQCTSLEQQLKTATDTLKTLEEQLVVRRREQEQAHSNYAQAQRDFEYAQNILTKKATAPDTLTQAEHNAIRDRWNFLINAEGNFRTMAQLQANADSNVEQTISTSKMQLDTHMALEESLDDMVASKKDLEKYLI
jgi:hypothetical protein